MSRLGEEWLSWRETVDALCVTQSALNALTAEVEDAGVRRRSLWGRGAQGGGYHYHRDDIALLRMIQRQCGVRLKTALRVFRFLQGRAYCGDRRK